MEGRVLIVEPRELVRRATTRLLMDRGCFVIAVDSGKAASCLPHHFQCGIFGNNLPDVNAISLVGWFLVERRIEGAVFFGEAKDDIRLRASNLGVFVGYDEGLNRLVRATLDCLAELRSPRSSSGGPSLRIGPLPDLAISRRVVV